MEKSVVQEWVLGRSLNKVYREGFEFRKVYKCSCPASDSVRTLVGLIG